LDARHRVAAWGIRDLSLDTWMALTPLNAHLKLDHHVMAALRKTKVPVVPT
jgi:hypothetical protein